MSRSCIPFFLSLCLCLAPTSVLAWDYVPYQGDNLGYLAGGTRGTLFNEHPQDMKNEFAVEKQGKDTLFFDDEENKSSSDVWVKTPKHGKCTWYFYWGALKFQDKYFLGLPSQQHEGSCNKP
jgi:hypothetical protein